MSCYSPFLGVPDYDDFSDGKRHYKLLSRYSPEAKLMYPGSIKIPCGKCLGCRLDYSRQWADRMMLEYDNTRKGIFCTLTYNNDHVPFTTDENCEFGWLTLCKSDVQLFFKRLRKKFPDRQLKYYIAGEYGPTTERPHYHACIFGLSLGDLHGVRPVGLNDLNQPWYTAKEIADSWSLYDPVSGTFDPIGFVQVSDLNWKTCAYCSRYVQKKVFHCSNLCVERFGCDPEFSIMSRRPGLGASYMENHPDWTEYSQVYISGHDYPIHWPKYFLTKLKDCDKLKYDQLMEQRQQYASDVELLKLQRSDLSYLDQLEVELNSKMAAIGSLRRDRVDKMPGFDVSQVL